MGCLTAMQRISSGTSYDQPQVGQSFSGWRGSDQQSDARVVTKVTRRLLSQCSYASVSVTGRTGHRVIDSTAQAVYY